MSRAKQNLLIVIGAKSVECGVISHKEWISTGNVVVPITTSAIASTPWETLQAALKTLTELLSNTIAQQGTNAFRISQVRVLVADRWLSFAQIPWRRTFTRAEMTRDYAVDCLQMQGFDIETGTTIRLEEMFYQCPVFAIAYPPPLMTHLQQLCGVIKANLVSVLPISVAASSWASRQYRDRSQLLAIVQHGWISVVHGSKKLENLFSRSWIVSETEKSQTNELLKEWQRLRLRHPQLESVHNLDIMDLNIEPTAKNNVSKEVRWLHLFQPAAAATVTPSLHLARETMAINHRLDAMDASPSTSALRWAIAAVAVLLTLGTVFQAWRATTVLRTEEARIAAIKTPIIADKNIYSLNKEEQARARTVNQAIHELNLPMSGLMKALHPPRDIRIALLGIDVLPGRLTGTTNVTHHSVFKIVAESPTGIDMARYVSYLSEQKPFTGAYLVRHEMMESVTERPYRFTVEARWND